MKHKVSCGPTYMSKESSIRTTKAISRYGGAKRRDCCVPVRVFTGKLAEILHPSSKLPRNFEKAWIVLALELCHIHMISVYANGWVASKLRGIL
jgi:hypothetical protein